MQEPDEPLFDEFPPVSTPEWEAKIHTDLKGADYTKKLIWKTIEGFNVKPYYRADDLSQLSYLHQLSEEFPYRGATYENQNEWLIRQDLIVHDGEQANRKALAILQKGVTSIGFRICNKIELNPTFLENILNGICLSAVELNFVCKGREVEFVTLFTEYVRKKGYQSDDIRGSINFDTVAHLVTKGTFSIDNRQQALEVTKNLLSLLKNYPNFHVITVHGSHFTNAGASIVQSLAFAMAIGADYLTWLTDAGLKASDIVNRIKFNFAISSDYFMEIARIRAARWLWTKIAESYELDCKVIMNIHAETSQWNQTIYDPYVNVLRSTTETMSAAIGGINSMTVIPFDSVYENPTDLAERVARNTQIILQEESYFNKMVDPSGGSYYIENLTDAIITEGWKLFLELQAHGGFVNAFKEGLVQARIHEVAAKRKMAIATRREILVGTNQYPDFNEVIDRTAIDSGHGHGTCNHTDKHASTEKLAEPLSVFRGAEAFENLRQVTDNCERRPHVFMLTIGNVTMRKARAAFACNFFACAGFIVSDQDGFATIDEGVRAALQTKADIIVICSSDDEYASLAPEAYTKTGDKAIFVVAGDPLCRPDLEVIGIRNFISIRSNVLETLSGFQKQLGL